MIPAQPLWSVLQETDLRFEETDQAVGTLLSVSKDKGIVRYSDLFPDRAIRAENHDRYKFVKSGSIVLNKMSASSGAVGVAKEAGIVSPDYAVLETKSFNNERFINYILGSADFCKNKVGPILRGIGTGDATSVRTPRVGMSEYLSLSIPVPPLETQQRIADYLDRETAEIDAAVADLDLYVDLLEKRQQLLISNVVNGRSRTPENDQAVPYAPLGTLLAAPITDGPHSTPEFLSEGIPFLSVDGIQRGELVFEGSRYISLEDHEDFSKKARPQRGDILMGKAASTGKIALVRDDIEFSIWSPLAIIRAGSQIDPEFLAYALKSSDVQVQIDQLCSYNTQKNIAMRDIPRIRIPLPSKEDQLSAVAYLNREITEINNLIDESQKLRDLLLKRRSVLITEVVTGRKQV